MSDRAAVQTQIASKPRIAPVAGGMLQRACACGRHTPAGGECEECKQKRGGALQRAAVDSSPMSDVPPIVHEALRSPGQPLDVSTRAFMEPRFGHDFSGVRVHTDARAAESARAVDALAYTMGRDIVFGAGQYVPGASAGRRLMAHELAHVVQQHPHTAGETSGQSLTIGRPYSPGTTGVAQIARQDAGGSQAGSGGSGETTPSFLRSTIQDFCQPFGSRQEARAAHQYAQQSIVPLIQIGFGSEVASLWQSYLNRKPGDSLGRRVFSSPSSEIVQGFVQSVTTNERQRQLIGLITARLSSHCPSLPPGVATNVPISTYLTREELEYPINFNQKFERPGNIAGGVSESDAGPDTRQVSGYVTFLRDTDSAGRTTNIHLQTHFNFVVRDATDFCPGGAGASDEQAITILLSRLEATGLFLQDEPFAYDMPFEVRYPGNPIEMDLEFALVRQCFPDATPGTQPSRPPTPEQPPESPGDRRPEREDR
jgi:hypothetical protein